MTDWVDRVLAQALESAGSAFTEQQSLGRLVWSAGTGERCYVRGGSLTIKRGGATVYRVEVVGVDVEDVV